MMTPDNRTGDTPLPALRGIDIFPMEHEGENFFCMHDPSHTVEDQLLLTPPAVFIAAQLTGTNTIADVQAAFAHQFDGMPVSEQELLDLVGLLDEKGFLQTENYENIRATVQDTFLAASARPAFFAGRSYPDDPDELRSFLDEQFLREGGPGRELNGAVDGKPHLPGLIVPHIDLHRGGHSYAHGYERMYQGGRPDTVFIFGVAHMAEPVPFILTRKDFETPLGTLETDAECMDRLEEACDWDPYAYELSHRTEHSIEFHALMLAYLYGSEVKIVPVLCSMFSDDPYLSKPAELESVQKFLEACKGCVNSPDKRVSVIAAADLAHVGKRFGDEFDIDENVVKHVAERDTEDLAHVLNMQPEDFFASVMKDANERKVCGIKCIYAALRTLEGTVSKGIALHYDYAHDPAGGIVSFASIALV